MKIEKSEREKANKIDTLRGKIIKKISNDDIRTSKIFIILSFNSRLMY